MNFYVYQYVRRESSNNGLVGSPYYVGKGLGPRAYAKRKGVSVPNKTRIEIVATSLREDEAFVLEMALIAFYGRIDMGTGMLRNRTCGGEGFAESARSLDANRKRSRALKGRKRAPLTERQKFLISAALKGRTRDPEASRKCGDKLRSRLRPEIVAALSGKKRPPHVIAKIKASLVGHVVSEGTREKLSRANTGKKHSIETRAKMSAAQKSRNDPRSGL